MITRTWTEIDPEALAWNYRQIQNRLDPGTQVLAVVKANAYGHGMAPIAPLLHDLGIRWFGVANVTEGAELRHILPDVNILVLGCISDGEIDALFEHELIGAIHSLRFAQELNARAQRRAQRIRAHLKLDTGMGRLGMSLKDVEPFLRDLPLLSRLSLEGVLSHFSSADEEDLALSMDQCHRFDAAIAQIRQANPDLRWIHLANSNGIFRLKDSHFNLVRAGLFLYGLYLSKNYPHDFDLKPVLQWKSRVGLIKHFDPGQTISYGRTHTVQHPTQIAVIPVGYADGYNRKLSNRGKVLIGGRFTPVVGRVTMDHIMADIGHIKGVKEGDEVILIGRQGQNQIRAEDIAEWLDTISYEVVCAIGPRVERKTVSQDMSKIFSKVDKAQPIVLD